MVITDREHFPRTAQGEIPEKAVCPSGPGLDVPLSAAEQHVAGIVEGLPDPMLRLLAGLAVRVGTADPAKRWSLTYWSTAWSALLGEGDRWEMRWQREPDPRQVADALIDPVAGITGAQSAVALGGSYIDVTLDGARLRLRQAGGRGD